MKQHGKTHPHQALTALGCVWLNEQMTWDDLNMLFISPVCVMYVCVASLPAQQSVSRATLIFGVLVIFIFLFFIFPSVTGSFEILLNSFKCCLRLNCAVCLLWLKKTECQAKIAEEQMSRWPSGYMWFSLLYVEVLFCCCELGLFRTWLGTLKTRYRSNT